MKKLFENWRGFVKESYDEDREEERRKSDKKFDIAAEITKLYNIYQKNGSESEEFKLQFNHDMVNIQQMFNFLIENRSNQNFMDKLFPFFKMTDSIKMLVHMEHNDSEPVPALEVFDEKQLEEIPTIMTKLVIDTFDRQPAGNQIYRKFVDYYDQLLNANEEYARKVNNLGN